jgi:tetrahydromethanopterin S-methyltransferase subunit G
METLPRISAESERLVDSVEPALKGIDHSSFSPAAFSALKVKVSQYIADLVEESAKASRRDNLDIISVKHIEIAGERLKQFSSNKIFKNLGVLGGVLLGACLSNLYPMITSNQITLSGVLFTLISGIIGAVFLMMSFMKE